MKAAVMRAWKAPLEIEDVELDDPGPREVLVRTVATGVCHSDLHVIEGALPVPPPTVLGHEPAGIVETVGAEVTHVKPGDHVIGCLSAFCGSCFFCLSGQPNLCGGEATTRPPGGKRVVGSVMGSNRFRLDMPRYVDFYLDGRLKLDEMISARVPLEQINGAFDRMKAGEVARSVVTLEG